MKFYLIRPKAGINACAEYDKSTGMITIKKGSHVSSDIATGTTFRGAKAVEKARSNGIVVDSIVTTDVVFKSPSTAANFVTGRSTNGCTTWKDEDGRAWKEVMEATNGKD